MRNVKNILMHELIGLECTVTNAKNKNQIGINGKITNETMKTVSIGKKAVWKDGTTFRIKVDNDTVDMEGKYIICRPEDRIKKKVKRW